MRVITENNEDALSRIDTSMNISASIHISNLPNSNPAELYNFRDSYKEELLKWVQKAVGYLFFFILLQLSNSLIIPIYISILPLFLLDFKVLLTSYLRSRGGLSKRFFLSAPAITQYCSIVFKVILIYYLGVNLFEPFFFLVPVFVTCCIDFWNRVPKTFECKYLTWLVLFYLDRIDKQVHFARSDFKRFTCKAWSH